MQGGKIVGTRTKYSDPLLKDIIGRAAAAKARFAGDDKDILTREEWENGWDFGEDGGKVDIDERYRAARDELEARLDEMRERLEAEPPCPTCGR